MAWWRGRPGRGPGNPHSRSAQVDARPAPHGGRPALRRRRRHAAEAGADLRCGGKHLAGAGRAGVILLSAQGRKFTQAVARELAWNGELLLICGRYEGVDERVAEHLADDELSIGDYVLSGGELAAAVVMDAVARLLPGVLGNSESTVNESFEEGILDCPQWTRPAEFRGWKVPDVLLSGNHAEIRKWRERAALEKTARLRPDLIQRE